MKQLYIVIFVGIISLISLGIIIFNFDPFQAVGYVKFLFFASLFLTGWSGITVVVFYLSRSGQDLFERAFKKGFLLSVIILAIFLGLRLK